MDEISEKAPIERKPLGTQQDRMNQMFSFIVEYKSKHDGNSPTFKEIMIGVGFATTSHVSYWMERLKKSGRISYSSDRRSIEVKGGVWKLKHPMID